MSCGASRSTEGSRFFYSLSNFIFQNETLDFQPGDNYEQWGLPADALVADFHDIRAEQGQDWLADEPNWDSVIASPVFRDGQLQEVVLHPIGLGYGLERPDIGRPMLAPRSARSKRSSRSCRSSPNLSAPKSSSTARVGRIRVSSLTMRN